MFCAAASRNKYVVVGLGGATVRADVRLNSAVLRTLPQGTVSARWHALDRFLLLNFLFSATKRVPILLYQTIYFVFSNPTPATIVGTDALVLLWRTVIELSKPVHGSVVYYAHGKVVLT